MSKFFTLFLLLSCHISYSQNLVPDSSFESYTNCPHMQGQITCPLAPNIFVPTLTDWFSTNVLSPDYYHSCATDPYVRVPNNFWGHYVPHTGNAFVGIVAYAVFVGSTTPQHSYREYVECRLTQPLVAGQTYYISCYVRCWWYDSKSVHTTDFMALDRLEARLTTTQACQYVTPTTATGAPLQKTGAGPITDTTWVRLTGTYVATGGEEYLTLGTFNNNIQPSLTPVYRMINQGTMDTNAYYFIDDVSLRTTPPGPVVICDTNRIAHDTMLCTDQPTLLTPESIASAYMWNTSATTTTIQVNADGVYWRIASTGCDAIIDTFKVQLFEHTYQNSHDTTICFPTTMALAGVANAKEYKWSTGGQTAIINVTEPGSYYCKSYINCDLHIDTFTINSYKTIGHIELGSDTMVCRKDKITIGTKYDGATYLWNTGDTGCCIVPQSPGRYTIEVNDGCKHIKDSINIDIVACDNCIFVPSAFTPNGDGKNDAFGAIAMCPLSSFNIQIRNRVGAIVYQSSDITSKWDGLLKSEPCDVGTFYYFIRYTSAIDGQEHLRKGDVTLIR